MYYNILALLISNFINLLSINLLNKLKSFLKLAKTSIIFIVLDTFPCKTNYIILI